VLNARHDEELRTAADRINASGGRAISVAGDVADDETLELVAQRALDEFGGFDTWVNNAGIGMYGTTWEMPLADKRRLFDINFWGVVHGCRAAVPHLREHGGALINIGSVASDVATPLLGIYSASKFAVKG
jgi:NAD(P)-dependent dehydrogenase (short-subunit alcohol dehydrogenase family)